jgi:hypothetical protein
MKPPVPGSIRNLEHRSSWCCHVWTWAKLVLFFLMVYFQRMARKPWTVPFQIQYVHMIPHLWWRKGKNCIKAMVDPITIQIQETCAGKRAPGLHTFSLSQHVKGPFWAGDVVKILLDHVVYFWKQDLGHFEDTSCSSFFTIPSPRIHLSPLPPVAGVWVWNSFRNFFLSRFGIFFWISWLVPFA